MAPAPTPQNTPETEPRPAAPPPTLGERAPDRLKRVPASRDRRERIRTRVERIAAGLDKSRPLRRQPMETLARGALEELHASEDYLGWTMVALATAFWRDQVAMVPTHRRLLLLPHCLRNAELCPARYSELGLLCQDCGACRLTDLRAYAESKGYKVMIAEGSPVVMRIILEGYVDAIMGVACLDSLEKALDKILLAGVPSMAVPLWDSKCRDSQTDEDWIRELIDTPYRPAAVHTSTFLYLMRAASRIFDPDELDRLVPRLRSGPRLAETNGEGLAAVEPAAATEAVAYDFLSKGGKYSRPFVTLAVYDAVTGGCCTGADGQDHVARLPDAVRRVALAIESFHKASLVHDDVEDDDAYRYGQPTLHRRFGTATAINVGDYLIGLGYRLVSAQRQALGHDVVADVIADLAEAHTRLCEGQGAELVWRDARNKHLSPVEALRIYALKTAPAFEAAIYAGLRLAGPADTYRQPIARFARHLGVAFQILNDLDDWYVNRHNKRVSGNDVVGRRPTVLWALALQGLRGEARRELESLVHSAQMTPDVLERVRELYVQAGAFRDALALIAKHHDRARGVADKIQPEPLGRVLSFLLDVLLDRSKHEP